MFKENNLNNLAKKSIKIEDTQLNLDEEFAKADLAENQVIQKQERSLEEILDSIKEKTSNGEARFNEKERLARAKEIRESSISIKDVMQKREN